jgi:hypothetical protein
MNPPAQSIAVRNGDVAAKRALCNRSAAMICHIAAIAAIAATPACSTSSQTLTGTPRPAVAPSEVTVYTHAPPDFQEIALLSASRKSVSTAGGERAIEKIIDDLKMQAAALGANGLLLEDISDKRGLSVGTGVGTDTFTHNGSISLGVGTSLGLFNKFVESRAIWIPNAPASSPVSPWSQ